MGWKLAVGIILLLLGIFYALPHDIHLATPLHFGLEHATHIVLGILLLLFGVVLVWKR